MTNVQEPSLKDAVLLAYEKGHFTVSDEDEYGCIGLHCKVSGDFANGFYAYFEEDGVIDLSAKEFVASVSKEHIAECIASTLEDFINEGDFAEEAYNYLLEVKSLCEAEGRSDYLDAINYWMDKAEKISEQELD